VSLNADDPGMFGYSLTGEYLLAHDGLGIAPDVLRQRAATSIERSSAHAHLHDSAQRAIDTQSSLLTAS